MAVAHQATSRTLRMSVKLMSPCVAQHTSGWVSFASCLIEESYAVFMVGLFKGVKFLRKILGWHRPVTYSKSERFDLNSQATNLPTRHRPGEGVIFPTVVL